MWRDDIWESDVPVCTCPVTHAQGWVSSYDDPPQLAAPPFAIFVRRQIWGAAEHGALLGLLLMWIVRTGLFLFSIQVLNLEQCLAIKDFQSAHFDFEIP